MGDPPHLVAGLVRSMSPTTDRPRTYTYTGAMSRVTVIAAAVATAALSLSGCAEVGLSTQDAYKVGCPAIDTVAGSGSAVSKVTLSGLQQLSDSGNVTGETKGWLDAAIAFLSDPNTVSAEAKKMLRDGCAANGYELKNI